MQRRSIISLAGGVTLGLAPLASFVQAQGKVWRVGYLALTEENVPSQVFRNGLRDLGYIEGRNMLVERRVANGNAALLPQLAAELVRLKVDVLVAPDPPSSRVAMQATTTIPIVFRVGTDPVSAGIVASLAHPGGNATGVYTLSAGLNGKRMELLKELVPSLSRLALLYDPGDPDSKGRLEAASSAARALAVQLIPIMVHSASDFDLAFKTAAQERVHGLLYSRSPLVVLNFARIVGLAAKARLPVVYDDSVQARAGGLMSYGTSLEDVYRYLASFVDKILRGAKPGDLPIEQPTQFELVVNMKTAKELGIKIPQTILLQATKVIE